MDHDMGRGAMVSPRENKVKRQVHNYWAEVCDWHLSDLTRCPQCAPKRKSANAFGLLRPRRPIP